MIIFWHSRDLRIEENLALAEASQKGLAICPLFILEEEANTASYWWLQESLKTLQNEYEKRDVKLIFRRGNPLSIFKEIHKDHKIDAIFANINFEPKIYAIQKRLQIELKDIGIPFHLLNGNYLLDLDDFPNRSGTPYLKFTPFWEEAKKAIIVERGTPLKKFEGAHGIKSEKLEKFTQPWAQKLKYLWFPGRAAGLRRIKTFYPKASKYGKNRDYPGIEGTSKISPYLHFGEISPFEVWKAIAEKGPSTLPFLRELVFREFSAYFLFHFGEANYDKRFNHFAWSHSEKNFERWKKGQTGYPIVDAGMRELWQTGWMHNRVRMVVASFLTKHLLIDWRRGAEWFLETLVDADLASNTFNWQWVAGCGLDSAPYFRIFNPILQAEKFDKSGDYIRKFVPEIARLPDKWITKPHLAPPEVLEKAGIILGKTYKEPVVNHEEARETALALFKQI